MNILDVIFLKVCVWTVYQREYQCTVWLFNKILVYKLCTTKVVTSD